MTEQIAFAATPEGGHRYGSTQRLILFRIVEDSSSEELKLQPQEA
jgi:hypothetical protein